MSLRAEILLWAQRVVARKTDAPAHLLLEIAAEASLDEARDAFHKIARTGHPDLHRSTLTPQELEVLTSAYARVAGAYQDFRSKRTPPRTRTVNSEISPTASGSSDRTPPVVARSRTMPGDERSAATMPGDQRVAMRPKTMPGDQPARSATMPGAQPTPPRAPTVPTPRSTPILNDQPTPRSTPILNDQPSTRSPTMPDQPRSKTMMGTGSPSPSSSSPGTPQPMNSRALIYYRKVEQCLRNGDLKTALLNMKMAIAGDPQSAFLRTALAELESELAKK